MDMSISKSVLMKRYPEADAKKVSALSELWDQVLHLIIEKMIEFSSPNMTELHINLREEMASELAMLQLSLGEKIINERIGNQFPNNINVEKEQKACFGESGVERINNTAKILAEHVWLKKYNERWKPKSLAAIRKEKSSKKVKLAIEPKEDNHFIPKSFIKRYWSENGKIRRYKIDPQGRFILNIISFGQWGFLKNLYSDRLEAYFGLIEGDAVQPISMLLNVEPLNRPQKEALIGFIVIQRLRNPIFIETLRNKMVPVVEDHVDKGKSTDSEYMRKVYETLYEDNEFYDRIARPIMKNQWVVVRSELEAFILPDTCNIFGNYDNGQYVIAPITPNDCLVVLPYENKEERIIPFYIKATDKMVQDICVFILLNVHSEFLAGSEFVESKSIEEEPNKIIQRIIFAIAKITDHQ